jgi:hypothetical protein
MCVAAGGKTDSNPSQVLSALSWRFPSSAKCVEGGCSKEASMELGANGVRLATDLGVWSLRLRL